MILENKKILIISPEAWGTNFVSKHNYALELSNKNRIYFLNPPSAKYSLEQINQNLIIVDYKSFPRGINRMPPQFRNYFNSLIISKIKNILDVGNFDIIWTFDPFRFQNLNLFNSTLMIYHPVDIHYTSLEQEVAKSAQIIFTSCELIKDKIKKYNLNIYNIGHGISKKFLIKDISNRNAERIIRTCMMGNLQRKIDYPVLFNLIEKNPDVKFEFIGPYKISNLSKDNRYNSEINHLKLYKNTCLYGPLGHDQLIDKLYQMDLFLNFYLEDENPAARVNPHKMLEFLSTGKTVLSYYMDEYRDNEDLLIMTRNKTEIPMLFDKIINNINAFNDPKNMSRRRDFALQNTYGNKITHINSLLKV